MKVAKGFKGRYFSLAAITATSSQTTLHARITAFRQFFIFKSPKEAEDEETQDPPELLETELQTKPCYRSRGKNPLHAPEQSDKVLLECNCIFKLKTLLALQSSKLSLRPSCKCRFRKTGLAPPPFFSSHLKKTKTI